MVFKSCAVTLGPFQSHIMWNAPCLGSLLFETSVGSLFGPDVSLSLFTWIVWVFFGHLRVCYMNSYHIDYSCSLYQDDECFATGTIITTVWVLCPWILEAPPPERLLLYQQLGFSVPALEDPRERLRIDRMDSLCYRPRSTDCWLVGPAPAQTLRVYRTAGTYMSGCCPQSWCLFLWSAVYSLSCLRAWGHRTYVWEF